MRKMGKHIPGLIVTLVVLITAIVFAVMLLNMKVIPTKFIAVIGLVMLVLVVIVGALVWSTDGKIRFVVGVILAAVFAAVFILGSMYVYKTHSTLAGISGVNTEVTEVGIYVRADDSADSIGATADYVYGVLTDLDRANSDKAIQEVDSETGKTVQVQEFAGLTELVDGLLNGQTGAIVLNSAYLSVIEEMDGYSDISSRIRELTVKKVETTIEPQETEAKAEENTNDGSVYTIFISGIDSRSGLVAKSRSDSNIIATVNTATRQVLLVSTPRDYYITISDANGRKGIDKLTHAGNAGTQGSIDALYDLYGFKADYFMKLNFDGCVKIVDALGGITIDSEVEFTNGNDAAPENYHFVKGLNECDGAMTLAFVRERQCFMNGDFQRGRNQQAAISGIINKATSPSILTSYSSVLEAATEVLYTNMPTSMITGLIKDQLADSTPWNVQSYAVSGRTQSNYCNLYGFYASTVVPDYDTVNIAIKLMNMIYNDETVNVDEYVESLENETATGSAQ